MFFSDFYFLSLLELKKRSLASLVKSGIERKIVYCFKELKILNNICL